MKAKFLPISFLRIRITWKPEKKGKIRVAWGEMPNVGEGEKKSKTHYLVCTYANVLHVLHMYPKT